MAGSGKDTVAEYLVAEFGFEQESFAGTLKDAVAAIFSWDREMLEGKSSDARVWREEVDVWWANRLGIPKLTPRWVLQNFGTNVCRRYLHDDIWIASLARKLSTLSQKNVVISDARFLNELTMLKSNGAKTVRVKRGVDPDWFTVAQTEEGRKTMSIRSDIHPSEWDWAIYNFDLLIINDGSLAELYSKAKSLASDR